MTQKTALVLGGAGFIGSHLVRSLLEDGYKVHVVDDFSTGRASNLSGYHYTAGHLQVHTYDVAWMDAWIFLKTLGPFHEIYNLACPASPVHYQADPIRTIMTSVQGTYESLVFSEKQGAKYFMASTSEIYGDPLVHPQTEDYFGNVNPYGPRACYDNGKRMAETLCYEFRDKAHVRIGRIFNTYGPNMQVNDGRVISNFMVQAIQNKPITVYGHGNQTRSFCYVSDMVKMIRGLTVHATCTGPTNIGNNIEEHKIIDIANMVIEVTGSYSKIVHKEMPGDDPRQRRPDIDKACVHEIVPANFVSLRDGLFSTYKYFRALDLSRAA